MKLILKFIGDIFGLVVSGLLFCGAYGFIILVCGTIWHYWLGPIVDVIEKDNDDFARDISSMTWQEGMPILFFAGAFILTIALLCHKDRRDI